MSIDGSGVAVLCAERYSDEMGFIPGQTAIKGFVTHEY